MKKEDEIEFFRYLIDSEVHVYSGYISPGRQKIELFDMPDKRKEYILEKWFRQDIWNCGGSIFNGWFEKDAIEKFTINDKHERI